MSQYRGRRRSFRNTILLMLVLVLGLAVSLVWSNTVLQGLWSVLWTSCCGR